MTDHSQLARMGLFDARVPRYTSYPTAPHFGTGVGPETHGDWISAIPANSPISLYIHVPFCRRLCWFCACRTQGVSSDDPVRAYLEVLKSELALLKARLAPGVTLSRLHWGGGTPTLMAPDMIEQLAEAILNVAPLGAGGEFSVEIDPNEVDAARLDALTGAGMNRASIGVQDFDPMIQTVIGREQSFEITRAAVDMIRARGVASLNADILYGLPHQTASRIAASTEKLLSLSPDRVALYGYAHVPWMARRQVMIPEDAIPEPRLRLGLFETASALFEAAGHMPIGIDHFALPSDGLAKAAQSGGLRRNFQGYTDDTSEVLIGVGASSISRFPQGFTQNASATAKHTAAIRARGFSTARGHTFAGEDKARARMIEALMCEFRIDTGEMIRRFGMTLGTLLEMFQSAAAAFPGMVTVTPEGFAIESHARPLTRMIARTFDAYGMAKTGHSSAV